MMKVILVVVVIVMMSIVMFAMEIVMVVIVIWMKLVVMVATCKRGKKVSSLQKSKDSTAGKSLKGVEKVGKGGRTHLSNRSALG